MSVVIQACNSFRAGADWKCDATLIISLSSLDILFYFIFYNYSEALSSPAVPLDPFGPAGPCGPGVPGSPLTVKTGTIIIKTIFPNLQQLSYESL